MLIDDSNGLPYVLVVTSPVHNVIQGSKVLMNNEGCNEDERK